MAVMVTDTVWHSMFVSEKNQHLACVATLLLHLLSVKSFNSLQVKGQCCIPTAAVTAVTATVILNVIVRHSNHAGACKTWCTVQTTRHCIGWHRWAAVEQLTGGWCDKRDAKQRQREQRITLTTSADHEKTQTTLWILHCTLTILEIL